MEGHGRFVTVLLLFVIVADVSNASVLSRLRMLVSTNDSPASDVSPSPSPDPVQINNTTANGKTPEESQVPDKSPDVGSKELNNTKTSVPPTKTDGEKRNDETKKKDDKKNNDETEKKDDSRPENVRNCTGVPRTCRDLGSLVACILDFESGSKEYVVLVQNEGEKNLSVDLSGPNHFDDSLLEIPKHQTKQINIKVGNGTEIILGAGNGACILHTDPPVSPGNFFLNLPSYNKLITPINGAYFLILTVLAFGGTWACCMFRKKSQQIGIPYQELEMALPESSAANNAETAEGWDQDWDDDWDEENAVKSPPARHAGSISANGLTSRTSNRDGWENDWDD